LHVFRIILSRSLKKGPFLSANLVIRRLLPSAFKTNNVAKSRYSTVLPDFVGDIFQIHTGRSFLQVKVLDVMVGKKFGEFVSTRKLFLSKKTRNSR
jgi:small subunit ribosomal protein S19